MQLSLADAAIALGRSQRQIRYLIQTGGLAARKEGGRWVIDSADLPLSAGQRQALAERAEQARQALDKGLAPLEKGARDGKDGDKRHYSVTDFRAYQAGMALLRELRVAESRPSEAEDCLFQALRDLSRGCHAFQPADKAARFAAARDAAADAVVHLLLAARDEQDPCHAWAERLEQEFLPKVSALLASQEKRSRRNRRDRLGSFFPGAGQEA
jgi:hypothetical protein